MARFDGKPLKEVSVSHAIKKSDELIEEALSESFKTYQAKE